MHYKLGKHISNVFCKFGIVVGVERQNDERLWVAAHYNRGLGINLNLSQKRVINSLNTYMYEWHPQILLFNKQCYIYFLSENTFINNPILW